MTSILLLQEFTQQIFTDIPGYTAHYNTGTSRSGSALITSDLLTLTNIIPLPSGLAIAAALGNIEIINIYALSSTNRHKREAFNNELP
jgi:hypothetical protein